jgi:transposase-like protein
MQQSTKTREAIAGEYGVCPRTFRRWLKRANVKLPSGNLTPKYQDLIYETFGFPRILKQT